MGAVSFCELIFFSVWMLALLTFLSLRDIQSVPLEKTGEVRAM